MYSCHSCAINVNSKNHISAKSVRLPDYNTVNAFLDNCSEKKSSNLLQIELLEWYNHLLNGITEIQSILWRTWSLFWMQCKLCREILIRGCRTMPTCPANRRQSLDPCSTNLRAGLDIVHWIVRDCPAENLMYTLY